MPGKQGFASMDPAAQREIASLGGKAAQKSTQAHRWTPEQAREAGRKGGERISRDLAHMAEIGRKGGVSVSSNPTWMSEIGKRGAMARIAGRAAK